MIKIDNVEVVGLEPAIRGMRNPKNSWDRSDSYWDWVEDPSPINPNDPGMMYIAGENDLDLMKRLATGGPVHAKYRRMIVVYADITAPLYWWKEFDTYKVGTVANSCSTMHKIHSKEFTLDDFSHEHLVGKSTQVLKNVIDVMNLERKNFVASNDKDCWWQLIQLLPSSYNQRRTIMLNYEVLCCIYKHRKNHKLDEWHDLCKWIETLPYSELITLSFMGQGVEDGKEACR